MLERLLPSYTADRRQTPWTLQLFIFSSLFTSSSDFRRNALTRVSHPIVLPLCVSIFMTGGFPFLMLIYLFLLFFVSLSTAWTYTFTNIHYPRLFPHRSCFFHVGHPSPRSVRFQPSYPEPYRYHIKARSLKIPSKNFQEEELD